MLANYYSAAFIHLSSSWSSCLLSLFNKLYQEKPKTSKKKELVKIFNLLLKFWLSVAKIFNMLVKIWPSFGYIDYLPNTNPPHHNTITRHGKQQWLHHSIAAPSAAPILTSTLHTCTPQQGHSFLLFRGCHPVQIWEGGQD